MNELLDRMRIRRFEARDAEICFKIRSDAFIQKFYLEYGCTRIAAGEKTRPLSGRRPSSFLT